MYGSALVISAFAMMASRVTGDAPDHDRHEKALRGTRRAWNPTLTHVHELNPSGKSPAGWAGAFAGRGEG
jgi:hypothetical protein